MERLRFHKKEESKNVGLAPILKDFLRVGMWVITTEPDTGIIRHNCRYGTGEKAGVIIVHGKLCEHDRGAFLIIRALDKINSYEGFKGHITDLVKMTGVKNEYGRDSVNAMWDSVEALLNVHVRIKPNKLGGSLSAAFKMVTGYIESDGSFFLITHDYQKIVEQLNLFELNIPIKEYYSSRSPITRSIREFLRTQTIPIGGRGYQISLAKLCKYIGYDPREKPFWQIWPHINKSLSELKRVEFISDKSKRDSRRLKHEGGVITFWKCKDKTNTSSEAIPDKIDVNVILQMFPEVFQKDKLFQQRLQEWIAYRPGLERENWEAIVNEWTGHSINDVCFQINHAIASRWRGVFFKEKKEQLCPHGWTFGESYSNKSGCQEQCKIMEECRGAYFKWKKGLKNAN